jgi:hypothetical protein
MGAQTGQASSLAPDHSENNTRPWVRSHGQLGGKSSKRIQTGEPNFNPLKSLDREEAERLTPLFSGSNPDWGDGTSHSIRN